MYSFGGDARFFWPENIGNFTHIPSMWDGILNTGIGMPDAGTVWITSYLNLTSLFSKFGLNWTATTFLFWFLPAVIISFFSAFFLFKHFFPNVKFAILAGITYVFNTYFLLILGGGQFGVSLAYSLTPFVLLSFIRLFEKSELKNAMIAGLMLGVQMVFDPRLVFISLLTTCIFLLLQHRVFYTEKLRIILYSVLSLFLALLLNSFWMLPLIFFPTSLLPKGISSSQNVSFFSFADFSHALSLLHPNWPDNIFGKVYFLQPEFILLPLLAFGSLLLLAIVGNSLSESEGKIKITSLVIKNKKYYSQILNKYINTSIIFFSFLAILGVFLSKGTNPPFGFFYSFFFTHIPGFVAYRDPTKWYLLIAISYSILIPFSLWRVEKILSGFLKKKNIQIKFFSFIIPFLFLFLLIILLRSLFINNLFRLRIVPQEYVDLKNYLYADKTFSRSLWVPQWQQFGFFSYTHPAIGRGEVLPENPIDAVKSLGSKDVETKLQEMSIKYVILPYDINGEIFQKERKYDELSYQKTYDALKHTAWMTEIAHFGKIVVFLVPNSKEHFWTINNPQLKITAIQKNETSYTVKVRGAKKGDTVVFSESYSSYWEAKDASGFVMKSKNYKSLNSFTLQKNGDYLLNIFYKPQSFAPAGLSISGITLIIAGVAIFIL